MVAMEKQLEGVVNARTLLWDFRAIGHRMIYYFTREINFLPAIKMALL